MYTLPFYKFFKVVKLKKIVIRKVESYGWVYLFVIFCRITEVFKINMISFICYKVILNVKMKYKNESFI